MPLAARRFRPVVSCRINLWGHLVYQTLTPAKYSTSVHDSIRWHLKAETKSRKAKVVLTDPREEIGRRSYVILISHSFNQFNTTNALLLVCNLLQKDIEKSKAYSFYSCDQWHKEMGIIDLSLVRRRHQNENDLVIWVSEIGGSGFVDMHFALA